MGRLSQPDGKPELFAIPTRAARPYGIVVDPTGRPWVAEFGAARLATVDPASGAVSEIELPRSDARPRRLVLTSNGDVWYVDYLEGRLGRYRPADGSLAEWPVPGGEEAGPYGMAVDADDRIWFVETGSTPNRLVVFDSNTRTVVASSELDSGAVRHMVYASRNDAVWFGTDANTLVRARLIP